MPLNWDDIERLHDVTGALEYRVNRLQQNVLHITGDTDNVITYREPIVRILERCVRTLDHQFRNSAVLMAQLVDCLSCPMKDDCEAKFNKFANMGNFDTCVGMLHKYMLGGNASVLETLNS